jgi:uncharacterized membrane protein
MLKAALLGRIPLLAGLSDEERSSLAERLAERMVPAGGVVVSKGDHGTSMFIVLSGSARIFVPATATAAAPVVTLKEIGPGEYFGELALFDDQPRSATVSAITDTWVAELTRDDLLTYLQRSPSALAAMMREMSIRLRATTMLLSDRVAKDVAREMEEQLTWGQRLSDRVAMLNGSWAFILFVIGLAIGWASMNFFLPQPFDPYPYQFFNLFLAILVALQGPLIVMSQNRQALKDRKQSEQDFRVNLKNEVGIEHILRELTALRADVRGEPAQPSTPAELPGAAEHKETGS